MRQTTNTAVARSVGQTARLLGMSTGNQTRAAAAHSAWFMAEVEQAVREADNPDTQWLSHDEVMARLSQRRTKYAKTMNGA